MDPDQVVQDYGLMGSAVNPMTAFNAALSMNGGWNATTAARAKDLERQGLDAREIWNQTGTWKGPDGRWRQEIMNAPSPLESERPFFGNPNLMAQGRRMNLPARQAPGPLREFATQAVSLDPQPDQGLGTMAAELGMSFVPGVGQALSVRDIERARRANDPAGMALAATGLIPFGGLVKALRKGGPAGPASELITYHGTPHKFPPTERNPLGEFDAAKIGTGEGAQAYGHGLYFAENPMVAKNYLQTGGTGQFLTLKMKDGTEIYGPNLTQAHLDAAKALDIGKQQAGQFPHNTAYYAKKNATPEVAALIDEIKSFGYKSQASLYKVDLPDALIAKMLDWDKPLSQQPATVREALKRRITSVEPTDKFDMGGNALLRDNRLGQYDKTRSHPWILEASSANGTSAFGLSQKDVDRMFGRKDVANLTGEQIISRLAQQQGGQAAASKYLADLGIPGIRYLDQGSRAGNKGTSNFVVFPGSESMLNILERH